MIKIIDATLSKIDDFSVSRDDLLKFCSLMKSIGIIDLEISENVYDIMYPIPDGIRFYLNTDNITKRTDFLGIYKFIIHQGDNEENCISGFQINDIRELVKLNSLSNLDYVKITGMDDLFCHDVKQIFSRIMGIFPGKRINFCPENTYSCATALAVMWVLNGGCEVTSSFSGFGNMASTEEVIMALKVAKRNKPNQSLSVLPELKELYEKMTGEKVLYNKPIIGKNIFYVESGVHVDGILKNPANYEAYDPAIVGHKTKIILGKHSGMGAVRNKLEDIGYMNTDIDSVKLILGRVKEFSVRKHKSLDDEEFMSIVNGVMTYERKKVNC